MSFPWLSTALLLPTVGAVVVAVLPKREGAEDRAALPKLVALGFSLATLVVVAVVAVGFDPRGARYQFTETHDWIRVFGAHYALGVDGIGLTLVLMTAILSPVVILASWHEADGGRWRANAFFAWMLVLEGLSICVFSATDVFLFYVIFEATLIPIYFLIGGFGGPRRSAAAVKFLIYNLFGGLVMLAAVVGLYVVSARTPTGPTYLLSELSKVHIDRDLARWMFVAFFAAFAIKAPMVPVHTWLPDAAEEGSAGTSVMLVSVLDKIGTFGMIRFCLQLFPEASRWATPVVLVLAVVSVLWGALAAIGQNSIPRLIAYTSVSHFGFIVLGIFVLNSYGQTGSTLYMFNHGMSTAALFLVAGFLVKRRGSPLISDYGGVEKVAPVLAGIFLVAGLSSLSLPGLSPFISEFLVLLGAFAHAWWWGTAAVLGIVLAALYILLMYQRTMTGPTVPAVAGFSDLNVREVVALVPLLVLIVGLGFFPKPLTAIINPAVHDTLQQIGAKDPAPAVPAQAAGQETAR
ncbi:MAG: NADH-quinone oxidoreductase subunit [Nocardioidaceae bacterium]|nr:NADH-quinone oxidoreductase subunit [Nocardioidaceae bacterium]